MSGLVTWAEYHTGKWHAFREGDEISACELVEWCWTEDNEIVAHSSKEAPTVGVCRVCFRVLYDTGPGWDGTGWNTDEDRGYAWKRWSYGDETP